MNSTDIISRKIRKGIQTNSDNVIETDVFSGTRLIEFEPTNDEELIRLIKEFGIKTSREDPIPSIFSR